MTFDTDLKAAVYGALAWSPSVRAVTLDVEVVDGTVMLTGKATSHGEKREIERRVSEIADVRGVVSEIDVVLPADHRRGDLAIATAAANALEWNALVPKGQVKPIVEQGWITLNGCVPWVFHRQAAERAVCDLIGVTGVTNRIDIKPQVMASDLDINIRQALLRQAQREGERIDVCIDGSVVTLRGAVDSIADRKAVERAVWGSPGVGSVVNAITIRPMHGIPMDEALSERQAD